MERKDHNRKAAGRKCVGVSGSGYQGCLFGFGVCIGISLQKEALCVRSAHRRVYRACCDTPSSRSAFKIAVTDKAVLCNSHGAGDSNPVVSAASAQSRGIFPGGGVVDNGPICVAGIDVDGPSGIIEKVNACPLRCFGCPSVEGIFCGLGRSDGSYSYSCGAAVKFLPLGNSARTPAKSLLIP